MKHTEEEERGDYFFSQASPSPLSSFFLPFPPLTCAYGRTNGVSLIALRANCKRSRRRKNHFQHSTKLHLNLTPDVKPRKRRRRGEGGKWEEEEKVFLSLLPLDPRATAAATLPIIFYVKSHSLFPSPPSFLPLFQTVTEIFRRKTDFHSLTKGRSIQLGARLSSWERLALRLSPLSPPPTVGLVSFRHKRSRATAPPSFPLCSFAIPLFFLPPPPHSTPFFQCLFYFFPQQKLFFQALLLWLLLCLCCSPVSTTDLSPARPFPPLFT